MPSWSGDIFSFSDNSTSLISQLFAAVATQKIISGPVDDPSVQARLKGLQWLCTHGRSLPAGVERVLVMDTTDLQDLPLTNDDPNLPPGVDVEAFWKADGRKASRVLLRHGDNGECGTLNPLKCRDVFSSVPV